MTEPFVTCVALGADEVVLRSCETDIHQKPNKVIKWQCVVRHMNRTKAWGVGVHEDPGEASRLAFEKFIKLHQPAKPQARRRRRPQK